jgi:hypothetical protein
MKRITRPRTKSSTQNTAKVLEKNLDQTADTVETEASTSTVVETSIEQSEKSDEPSKSYKRERSASPKATRVRRRVVGTSKNEVKLVRVQLNKETFACSYSIEIWVLINSNFSKGFQKEKVFNIAPELVDYLSEHVRPIKVQVVLNQDGSYSLLYTKLTDGFSNSWMDSAEACSEQLEQGWGRVISDKVNQEYIFLPDNSGRSIPDADSFPNLEETIEKVFANSTINSLSDPVLEEFGIYIDPDLAA